MNQVKSEKEKKGKEIMKQSSSKRVTISGTIGPIEEFGKPQSRGAVPSNSRRIDSSMYSDKKNMHNQEGKKSNISMKTSRYVAYRSTYLF